MHCYCRLRVLLPLHFSSYLRELCCMQLLTFTNSFLCWSAYPVYFNHGDVLHQAICVNVVFSCDTTQSCCIAFAVAVKILLQRNKYNSCHPKIPYLMNGELLFPRYMVKGFLRGLQPFKRNNFCFCREDCSFFYDLRSNGL